MARRYHGCYPVVGGAGAGPPHGTRVGRPARPPPYYGSGAPGDLPAGHVVGRVRGVNAPGTTES